jgi:hypothetical protein
VIGKVGPQDLLCLVASSIMHSSRMIDLYSSLPKKNSHSASWERVAGRPTAAILDALSDLFMTGDGAFAGGLFF